MSRRQRDMSVLPRGLSERGRKVLEQFCVFGDSESRITISEEGGPRYLEINPPHVPSRSEGKAIAFVWRFEAMARFFSVAPGRYASYSRGLWCYQGPTGEILLELRFKVDIGLPRDPRPWPPPDRPLYSFASSLLKLVEKLAFFLDARARGCNQMMVRDGAREGERLARLLGAVATLEPSDGVHEFWSGEGFMLHDGELYGRNADECWLWLSEEATSALPAIVRHAARAGAAVEIAVPRFGRTEVLEPPEAPLVERVTRTREAASVSCPYGTEHEAQRGEVLLEDTSEGP